MQTDPVVRNDIGKMFSKDGVVNTRAESISDSYF